MNPNDFVIAKQALGSIEKNSVGIVKKINPKSIIVLFIGKQLELEVNQDQIELINISETGKGYNMKICNICAILKNDYEFDINQTDAKGIKTTRPSCKKCRLEIDGKPLSRVEKRRMAQIKPNGVFTCPICQKTGIIGVTVSIVQDHCHSRGIGREWICDSCNTGLGRFKDDIKILEKAIKYLKEHDN